MNIRKLTNISDASISVQVDERTTIVIPPGMELKDTRVQNLDTIKQFVSVEYDLSEVTPLREGRQKLNG